MKKSHAYSVYLLFQFCLYLAFSMATVLSVVYHLEVVQLDPIQLVLVGTALETACFLFEIPTGVVADLYSRRRSMLIGMFLLAGLMRTIKAINYDWDFGCVVKNREIVSKVKNIDCY